MSDLVVKYNRLNKTARQEVNDFMDFLLSKQNTNKTNLPGGTYKDKILGCIDEYPDHSERSISRTREAGLP